MGAFRVWEFSFWGRYEVHMTKDGEGSFLYEIEDLETLFVVDAKDGLTREELFQAVGCALKGQELLDFRRLVESL